MSQREWPTGIPRRSRPNIEARLQKLKVAGEVNLVAIFELVLENLDATEQALKRVLHPHASGDLYSPAEVRTLRNAIAHQNHTPSLNDRLVYARAKLNAALVEAGLNRWPRTNGVQLQLDVLHSDALERELKAVGWKYSIDEVVGRGLRLIEIVIDTEKTSDKDA